MYNSVNTSSIVGACVYTIKSKIINIIEQVYSSLYSFMFFKINY